MLRMVIAFAPIAALLTVTPGVATVLVVRRAAVSGRRAAFATTVGNEVGVIVWSVAAGLGLAAIVAASAAVFETVKLAGAAALIALGVAALLRRSPPQELRRVHAGGAFRDGIVTAVANPKLVAFYVALFPQFVPSGVSILAASCVMGALLVLLDLVWYSLIAALVARAADAFLRRWARRAERLCGAALVTLGLRLAYEQR
jgi:threonine/homoserine/homoserine lactone efflux protein